VFQFFYFETISLNRCKRIWLICKPETKPTDLAFLFFLVACVVAQKGLEVFAPVVVGSWELHLGF
jgi:hypothetical protein